MASYTLEFLSPVDADSRLHDYGLRRSAWIRAMALLNRFGSDRALDLADARAERALLRGDLSMCRRWRDLIVAIHAVEADEPLPTDRVH